MFVRSLGVGLILLAVDICLTYLVIGRLINRQDSRRRRAVSAIVEGPILDACDILLLEMPPAAVRSTTQREICVGEYQVAVQFHSLNRSLLRDALNGLDLESYLPQIARVTERTVDPTSQPYTLWALDSAIAAEVVRFSSSLSNLRSLVSEWRSGTSGEVAQEVGVAALGFLDVAALLHTSIIERWQ